jgi:hypothetical protein
MIWIGYFFVAFLTGVLGLLMGGGIGILCVDWFRISSFEGKSGYFVVMLGLVGGLVGSICGLAMTSFLGPSNAFGLLKSFGVAVLTIAVFGVVICGVCRMFADIPPKLDGKELMLQIELMLPVDSSKPTSELEGNSRVNLHSSVGGTVRDSVSGNLNVDQARYENDRWIIPGSVELFTMRGMRSIMFVVNGQDVAGFEVPLPVRPTHAHLEWSDWGPVPRSPDPPWPNTKPSFRFRVEKM